MNTTPNHESEFLAALARFERSVEMPVVPGELRSWLRIASQAFREVADLMHSEVSSTHARQVAEIVREDIALSPRVEEMKLKDTELHEQCETTLRTLDRLCDWAEQVGPNEAKLDPQVEQLTQQALAFVIECRKQEAALTTWYLEALNRDRGIAD